MLLCHKFSFGGSSGSLGLAFSVALSLSSHLSFTKGPFPMGDFGISVSAPTDLQIAAVMTISHVKEKFLFLI